MNRRDKALMEQLGPEDRERFKRAVENTLASRAEEVTKALREFVRALSQPFKELGR